MKLQSLKNRVALVTGAGGGLGRSHALILASYGAQVVVNDLGVCVDGSGAGSKAADETVELIKAQGGSAVADYSSVETMAGANQMVDCAIKHFGKIDIVVNNAGVLRDSSFKKQDDASWDKVISVHLTGSRNVTKAAWEHLCAQNYGRVIFTTSASGLYGNFGQSNYAAAKMGLWGLMQSLKEEGAKYQININSIAPIAQSRMTENIMPEEMLAKMNPGFVSPLVAYLSSEQCDFTGRCFAVGGGKIARDMMMETQGVRFESIDQMSVENIAGQIEAICCQDQLETFGNLMDVTQKLLTLPE